MLYISGFHFGITHMVASKGITRVDLYDAVHRKVGLSRGDSADLMEISLERNFELHRARRDS